MYIVPAPSLEACTVIFTHLFIIIILYVFMFGHIMIALEFIFTIE